MSIDGIQAWQGILANLNVGRVDTETGYIDNASNPYGMNDEAVNLWEDYYTGKQSLMGDYESYLKMLNVKPDREDEARYFRNFLIGKFDLKENEDAIRALKDSIRLASVLDGELQRTSTLSHSELLYSSDDIDGTIAEYFGVEMPEIQDVAVGSIPEHTIEFNVNLNKEAYSESMKARASRDKNSDAYKKARNIIARAIGKQSATAVYDENGEYTPKFQEIMKSVITNPKNQKSLNDYYEDSHTEKLDENATIDDILDLFIGINTDGVAKNDDVAYVFTIPETDITETKAIMPKENETIYLRYQQASNKDLSEDPLVKKTVDEYLLKTSKQGFLKPNAKLNLKKLNGEQIAQVIDTLYDNYQNNPDMKPVNFSGNDKKAIKNIIEKLVGAQNNSINLEAALWKLMALDGFKLGGNAKKDSIKDQALYSDYIEQAQEHILG